MGVNRSSILYDDLCALCLDYSMAHCEDCEYRERVKGMTDEETKKYLTKTGYFKANGDLHLDKCPFCGSSDVVYERYLHTAGYRWRVVCMGCMASIDPGCAQQRNTVQKMWNTRSESHDE